MQNFTLSVVTRVISLPNLPLSCNFQNNPKQNKTHANLSCTGGADGIYGEMLKAEGGTMVKHLHHLITRIWSCESVPEDWTKAIIVPLFKKGDPSVCDNWRGLSMLSVVGKVLAHVILARMCPIR